MNSQQFPCQLEWVKQKIRIEGFATIFVGTARLTCGIPFMPASTAEHEVTHLYHFLQASAKKFPERVTFRRKTDRGYEGRTYQELLSLVNRLTAGLLRIGLKRGDRVLFLCDPSALWLPVDLAIITAGGISTPRGTDITDDELRYIATHAECRIAFVQNEKTADRIRALHKDLPELKYLITLEDGKGAISIGDHSLTLLATKGNVVLANHPNLIADRLAQVAAEEVATIIYTSGTTGLPKGVMLSQKAMVETVKMTHRRFPALPHDAAISILPPWHVYERMLEYVYMGHGMDFLVSNISHLKDDMAAFKPTMISSVPRIWESVYNGIQTKVQKGGAAKKLIFGFFLRIGAAWARNRAIIGGYDFRIERPSAILSILRKTGTAITLGLLFPLKALSNVIFAPIRAALGGRVRMSFSGGSALPSHVDKFLGAIGVMVIEGYGMTETCAITSSRTEKMPSSGTIGSLADGIFFKLIDEAGKDVSQIPGKKGVLWLKSVQLFAGYYKMPDVTRALFDTDGYFNTGDIMKVNYRAELIFAGRAKDTVVLAGGENVEPGPIEERLCESRFISQCVVTGSERKHLSVLIVPDFENIKTALPKIPAEPAPWNAMPEVRDFFKKEILRLISKENGFKAFELIPGNAFTLLPRPFDAEKEMTKTLKIKRNVVLENYQREIAAMYM